jgi:hypothetical protein
MVVAVLRANAQRSTKEPDNKGMLEETAGVSSAPGLVNGLAA